ncbi:hypothetical protein RQP46_000244 [Phenoliferia psychrophenolica]
MRPSLHPLSSLFGLATLAVLAAASHSSPARLAGGHRDLGKRCTGTISSLDDVTDAVKCTTVNIEAFTVPVGETFALDLLEGTTVNVLGEVTFATGEDWAGPLASVTGTDITFNGNSYKWNGNGAYWWDGEGSNGGRTKPRPMFKVKISGTMSDVYLLASPISASVANPAALTISGATVDVADGNSDDGGHNTDGFDVSSSTDLTITGAYVNNQDCIAINDATNLVFKNSKCNGGHGISIGSIKTGKNVDGVKITDNTVTASANGLRIKTYVGATDASVSNVVYSGNTITGCTSYGVVIEQDYTNSGASGTASNTVSIDGVSFTGALTTVAVTSKAKQVYVLCGSTACTGTWDWSKLSTSGGSAGSISNADVTGYTVGSGSANGSGSATTAVATTANLATTTKKTTTTKKASSTSTKAATATATASSGTSRTSAPSGALVVSKSPSSGQYSTIAAAIKSLGSSTSAASIFVEAGTYSGSIDITYGGALTIYGYTTDISSYKKNVVTLTNGGSATVDGSDDASGTLRVHKDDFTMYNIDVVNSYGKQAEQSQALALSAYGKRQGFYGCSFVGYQDTVLTDTGTQLFAQSYVEGAVDYIFGQTANSWFDHCTIASVAAGTITASGRPADSQGIYVFNSCTITTAASATTSLEGLVYLGRPWTEYAHALFMFSSLSNIIAPAGWEEWSSSSPNTGNVMLAEYSNSGDGAATSSRVSWSKQLDSTSVQSYTISKLLGSDYADWIDSSYIS